MVKMAEKSVLSVELRPNRTLIDSNFDSYKLSLKTLPSYKTNVVGGVNRIVAGEDDFGYEKIRCLTLHNHLISDPWNKDDAYYVDSNAHIRRFHIPLENNIEPPKAVFSLGSGINSISQKLPPTVCFPSATLCIVCDGSGSTFLLDTGLRNERDMATWKTVYHDESQTSSMVLNGVCGHSETESNVVNHVDGIFLKFHEKKPGESKENESPLEVILEWCSFSKKDDEDRYNVGGIRVFYGKSVPSYVALSPDSSELHIASSSPFRFTPGWSSEADDEIEVLQDEDDTKTTPAAYTPVPYKWKQTNEDISVFVDMPPNAKSNCVVYSLSSKELNVAIRETKDSEPKTIISGKLFLDADPEASSWIICDGHLEITIQKKIEGRTWSTVVEGDDMGEFIVDPEVAAKVHEQLAHLTSDTPSKDSPGETLFNAGQLEDCDAFYDSTATLMRFDASSEKFTHVADISSLRWLFNCVFSPNEFPGVALRHDVDAVVWQPIPMQGKKEKRLLWKHIATFNALGYVHASKTNLKFCASAPDATYAALCECQRRVYVYRQPTPLSSSLRNRSSGTVVGKVALQQVATLDNNDDILGFAVTNERMCVLTSNELVLFKVLVDDGA